MSEKLILNGPKVFFKRTKQREAPERDGTLTDAQIKQIELSSNIIIETIEKCPDEITQDKDL